MSEISYLNLHMPAPYPKEFGLHRPGVGVPECESLDEGRVPGAGADQECLQLGPDSGAGTRAQIRRLRVFFVEQDTVLGAGPDQG